VNNYLDEKIIKELELKIKNKKDLLNIKETVLIQND
jgi:hypothetical protein